MSNYNSLRWQKQGYDLEEDTFTTVDYEVQVFKEW